MTWVTVAAVFVARRPTAGRRLGPLGYATVGLTFVLLISGSMVVDGGATYACPSWPFCTAHGIAAPLVAIQYAHRFTVLIVSIFIVLFVMHVARRWRQVPGARIIADLAAVLLLAQIAVGGLVATLSAPDALQDLHIALAAAIWVSMVVLATMGWLTGADSSPRALREVDEAVSRSGPVRELKLGSRTSTEEG